MKLILNLFKTKVARDSLIYVVSDFINKVIPFALLPILTSFLSPEDYGNLALFNSIVSFISIFIGLSIHGAISVNYYKKTKLQLSQYVGNVVYILLFTFTLIILLIFLFKESLFLNFELPFFWIVLAAFIALNSFVVLINLSLWLLEQKPKFYGSYQITETIVNFSLSLLFVIVFLMSWKGRALGTLIGSTLSSFISIYLLYKRGYLNMKFNIAYIKDALHFGVPLVPHQLSFWLRSGAIIFLLVNYVGKEETGLYNIGAQLVLPLSVITAAFNKSWAPYLYRKLSNNPTNREKDNIVKFTYAYFIIILVLVLVILYLAPFVLKYFLNERYSNSYIFIVYLAFSAAFEGMYLMVVNYIFYEKQTKYLAYITLFCSIINVMLAFALINLNGSVGAAQAHLISSILNFGLVWLYSNKIYKMPWKLKRVQD